MIKGMRYPSDAPLDFRLTAFLELISASPWQTLANLKMHFSKSQLSYMPYSFWILNKCINFNLSKSLGRFSKLIIFPNLLP